MSLTKADIIESVHQQLGFPKKKSTEMVEQLIETIKSTLASGEGVLVSGFGKFSLNEKRERKGRNPATVDSMMLRPRKVVTFKWSAKLRRRVNGCEILPVSGGVLMTYNFDPKQWQENEYSTLEAHHKNGNINDSDFEEQCSNLLRRYEEMLSRLDGMYQIPV